MSLKKQIVAIGGGDLSDGSENGIIDDFILGLSTREVPKLCFIPTASGDSESYIKAFYECIPDGKAKVSHLSLFQQSDVKKIRCFLLQQDIIYVGGGSSVNLLALWRLHEVDRILIEAWNSGVILAGISAGMNCWFEEFITDSLKNKPLPNRDGLGILRGSACPHYDTTPNMKAAFHEHIRNGELSAGWGVDEGVALHFIDDQVSGCVSQRPGAKAYYVKCDGDQIYEEEIRPQ